MVAGFERVRAKSTGRPGYAPVDLLKLYIYGYLNRIRSSRRLEVETHRNLEVIWLLRRLRPDFKTIADFRRVNRDAFRQVFRDFVRLCRELDLYGRELVAVDGTRIKGVNSPVRNFTRAKLERELKKADERLNRYLSQMDEADDDDPGRSAAATEGLQAKIAKVRARRTVLEGHRKTLEQSGDEQLSLTDPDSRVMKTAKGAVVGYNAQIAVDPKHHLIAEQQVHAKVTDVGLLAQTAVAARENLEVEEIDAVADKGYYKIDDVEACEAGGVAPHVPKPDRSPSRRKGLFMKARFRYDGTADAYVCPGGHRLRPTYFHELASGTRIQYANRDACRSCPLRPRCTTDTHRRISRYANEIVMDRMAERLAAKPELARLRRQSAEHPFGSIKQWMGQGRS
ncbi:MAG: IS1182 family transposase [Gammaproteobacteria bacterium]|nr:IS1182 family transposase [Gammaproteobacteria bacterium]